MPKIRPLDLGQHLRLSAHSRSIELHLGRMIDIASGNVPARVLDDLIACLQTDRRMNRIKFALERLVDRDYPKARQLYSLYWGERKAEPTPEQKMDRDRKYPFPRPQRPPL